MVGAGDAGVDDQGRCAYKGRADREVSETAGPGAIRPNIRRVFQLVGTGDSKHKVLICREVDTNLDGVKDIVRTYNEKGESLHEEADSNYDGRVDTWISFSGGHVAQEQLDSNLDGQPDVWKFYSAGQLTRIQRDTNRDGKPDRWEFYTAGRLERIGVDVDFDGHVDRWDHDEVRAAAEEAEAARSERGDGGAALPSPFAVGGSTSPVGGGSDGGVMEGGIVSGQVSARKRR